VTWPTDGNDIIMINQLKAEQCAKERDFLKIQFKDLFSVHKWFHNCHHTAYDYLTPAMTAW